MEEPAHTVKLSGPPNQDGCIQTAIGNDPWPVSASELGPGFVSKMGCQPWARMVPGNIIAI